MSALRGRSLGAWFASLVHHGLFSWAVIAGAMAVAGLGLFQHLASEDAIARLSQAYDHVSNARVRLTTVFVELAVSELEPGDGRLRRAAGELGQVTRDLESARTYVAALPSSEAVQQDLAAFGAEVAALTPDRLRALDTDAAITATWHTLAATAQATGEAMHAFERLTLQRIDGIFERAVLALGLVMAVMLTVSVRQAIRYHRAVSEARLQQRLVNAITDSTSDAVFMKDAAGRYQYLNATAERMLGAPGRSVAGRTADATVGPEHASRITDIERRIVTTGEGHTAEETLTLAGVRRTLLVTKLPATDEHGRVTGIVGIARDITGRKAEEEALRESRERLSLALRTARMGVWSVDLASGRVDWSSEVHDISGMNVPFADFEDFAARIHDDDRARVVQATGHVARGGGRFEETFRFVLPSGEVRWQTSIGEARLDADGRPVSITGLVVDVTDQKRLEQALRDSEAQHRQILETLPDAVFLNEGDAIAYANAAFLDLVGAATPGQVIGRPVMMFFADEDRARVAECIAAVRQTGQPAAPGERRVRRLDGRIVPAVSVGMPLTQYTPGAILVVMRDLRTERRATEWAASILDHALDGIVTTDAEGTVLTLNRAAEALFGGAAEEIAGRPLASLIPALAPRDQRVEAVARRLDGSACPIDVAISTFEMDGERQTIVVARDISDRCRLESELRQSHKMDALGQVAGGVAHDFNNLLTVILGYSDMLLDQLPTDDRRRQFASDIRRASGRAADLTRQLLTFSRRTVVAPKVLDLNAVVGDMNRMLRRVLGEDIELVTELKPTERHVFIDAGSLEQIVMNLTINARDAMPDGGRLVVSTGLAHCDAGVDAAGAAFEAGDYVLLSIVDTGTGIPDAIRGQIFEPFFTTKDLGKGTGLGLAVVESLVRQNGGFILLTSEPGRTAFVIGLPAVSEPAVAVEPITAPPRGAGETILVVEDEEPVRRLAVIALRRAGYRVLEAEDMASALAVFATEGRVDLLLTDVVMPRGGGRLLAETLQERQPRLPVLYSSGYADDAILRHGISRSDVAFLPKPYVPATLLAKVRDAIDGGHRG